MLKEGKVNYSKAYHDKTGAPTFNELKKDSE